MAQTETKKVLQMSVVRTLGNPVNSYLFYEDDFEGPTYIPETEILTITNTAGTTLGISRKRIKEIRFTATTIEVPTAIEAVEADENTAAEAGEQRIYDLSGRIISSHESLTRGIYIKGGKKFVINK